MKLLYNVWLEEFLCYLTTLKLHYDEGGDTAIKIFSDCDYDYESFEEDGYGKMYDAAEHVKCKTIYYPDENGQINDDCEPSYDIWFMSSRDMTEFYKTLNRLYQERRISFREYNGYKREMYDMAREYILYTNAACYGGASFYLRTKTNHKYASSISIYIDMNSCGSLFELTCGAATLFDMYSMKLNELREKYYDKDDEYWRRYDWIKKVG